jgi:asparagine synthase (glutamine-hydrolysing)
VVATTAGDSILMVGGPRGTAHAEDASGAVGLDGAVDNLADVLRRHGVDMPPSGGPAEAVLRLVQAKGLTVLDELEGEFALAFLGREDGAVVLHRDWYGFRPLFYARLRDGWAFASEPHALVPLLDEPRFDSGTLSELIAYQWTVGTATAVAGVSQLRPAHTATLRADAEVAVREYWRPAMRPEADRGRPEAWADEAEERIRSAIRTLTRGGGRVGVLLSGGVDSSLLTVLAAREGLDCVAYSVRFVGHPNEELERARAVAAHVGIPHVVVDVTDADIAASAEVVASRFDQPIRHFHAFVLHRLIDRAAEDVGTLLYGEAADTIFGSGLVLWLARYQRKRRLVEALPRVVRAAAEAALRNRRRGFLGRASRLVRWSTYECMLRMDLVSQVSDYRAAVPVMEDLPPLADEVIRATEALGVGWAEGRQVTVLMAENRSHLDMVDRLASRVGVMVRGPFLTPVVWELARRLPTAMKWRGGMSKPVLKDVACRHLPREVILAPKLGFPTPASRWLEGPLRPWLRLALRTGAHLEPYLDRAALRGLTLAADHQLLWSVASLEMLLSVLLEQRGSEEGVREILRRAQAGQGERSGGEA